MSYLTPWHGVLAELNVPSTDRRILAHDPDDTIRADRFPLLYAETQPGRDGVQCGVIGQVWTASQDGALQLWGCGFAFPGLLAEQLNAGVRVPASVRVASADSDRPICDVERHGTVDLLVSRNWCLTGATALCHGGDPYFPSARIWHAGFTLEYAEPPGSISVPAPTTTAHTGHPDDHDEER